MGISPELCYTDETWSAMLYVAICNQRPCGYTGANLYLCWLLMDMRFEEELIQLGARTPLEEELRRRDLR